MFVRIKPSGRYKYLQVVENYREGKKVKQQVLCTLGRLDQMLEYNQVDGLAQSLLRFSEKIRVLNLYQQNQLGIKRDTSIGPALVFDRLWHELKIDIIIKNLYAERKYQFNLERAIFLTVLHRLFESGSDRAADKWTEDYTIEGTNGMELHHLYRTMAWLGENLSGNMSADGKNAVHQIYTKDKIEHHLFEKNRDLFTSLNVVFLDTTSLYFEGEGGNIISRHGHSKDHRPDLKQMVISVVLDGSGRPICCDLLPGNTADIKTLIPTVVKIKQRFAVDSFCLVSDRGMISKDTMATLESPAFQIGYILGCRMRKQNEVRNDVPGKRGGKYQSIYLDRKNSKGPLLLKVKEVRIDAKRYIICHNPEQARKDAEDRKAIILSLKAKLKQGEKVLIGNKGYRKYLKQAEGGKPVFEIDEEKIKKEARFDGKWVLRTNTDLPAEEVACQYKQLWMVEQAFRTIKNVFETRPVYHKCDDTIRGHVFCSFLALVLIKELFARLEVKEKHYAWKDIRRDLTALREVELEANGETYFLRTELRGTCFDVLNAAGIAVPPRMRK